MSLPDTMRVVQASGFGLENLSVVERPVPSAARGEILVRVAAATLNYRDLAILRGSYKPDFAGPFIPASDACGIVVAVGADVTRFRNGDRVIPVYTQGWVGGRPTADMRANRTLGVPLDGVLREFIAVPAEDAVAVPESLSDVEAASLPIFSRCSSPNLPARGWWRFRRATRSWFAREHSGPMRR